ncbi:MAG: VWA domain-containing protein, partial [Planctomycetota bacterium]|nr:VWA domain-containing protein [Planctomycetota bacterium]
FQELLLLLLRVALLVLLALAMARPTSSLGTGADDEAVDAVLLFDVSYSMDAREGGRRRLDSAKAAALTLIEQLPPQSTVQIVTVAEHAERLNPPLPAGARQIRHLIEKLDVTHLATDFHPGVEEAAAALQFGDAAVKELYLFSDMQRSGWERQSSKLIAELQELRYRANVYLVRCGSRMPKNVAVVGLRSHSGVPNAGERFPFTVLVRNSGTETVRNLTVTLSCEETESRESQPLQEVLPGQTRAMTLVAELGRTGKCVVRATVEDDELSVDNSFDRVIDVGKKVRLLVVDGAPNDRRVEKSASYYLMHALLPVPERERAEYFVQPQRITAAEASPALLDDQDACLLVNAAVGPSGTPGESLKPEFVEALSEFVRQGGGVMIFGGDHVNAVEYNNTLATRFDLLPLRVAATEVLSSKDSVRFDRQSATEPPFSTFADNEYYRALTAVEIRGRLLLEEPADKPSDHPAAQPDDAAMVQVLLRYNDGRPAVASRRVGRGKVLQVSTSADVSWTDWPRQQGMFVPFVDLGVKFLFHELAGEPDFTAGKTIRIPLEYGDKDAWWLLVDPRGKSRRLALPDQSDSDQSPNDQVARRPVLMVRDTRLSGVYRLYRDDSTAATGVDSAKVQAEPANDARRGIPYAVAPNLVEGDDLACLSEADLEARLGFEPVQVVAQEDLSTFAPRKRGQREWSVYLLLVVCAVCLVETGWAWWCGRER